MAEGRNRLVGCGAGCVGGRCGWVPYPRLSSMPRRNALLDAIGRMDNPCTLTGPARCQPLCLPTPKFRLPVEKPVCNLDCYREEQAEAKMKEYYEQRQKYLDRYCPAPPEPEMIITALDPVNYPIAVEMPQEQSPENTWFLKEKPVRTNIIAGFFNPDDNKSLEDKRREKCDPFYKACGPNLPQYPCRGTIRFPCQEWVSLAQEQRLCLPPGCEESKYLNPEYMAQQQAIRDQVQMQKQMKAEQEQVDKLRRQGYIAPHPCCGERFSQTPFCNDCDC